ncbi:uncharacterized protein LOC127847861 [Dreissena polymorpha]|uniref:Uncharacterized protein n=1 Tax=Dreissena polymorpha TaxID=45954 RepID=A0A9D4DDA4_DREPO|nr:uncharacterized protein LOC127847861 [Dreissena polymorpha]KAH3746898.1 hypothetical protein DPMN_181316 [Dreissena polymorpha]
MDELNRAADYGLHAAKECFQMLKYSEGLVRRDIDLARIQLEIRLKKLEARLQAELRDLVETETFKIEEVIADINDTLQSARDISGGKQYQHHIQRHTQRLKKVRLKFEQNLTLSTLLDNVNSIGYISFVPICVEDRNGDVWENSAQDTDGPDSKRNADIQLQKDDHRARNGIESKHTNGFSDHSSDTTDTDTKQEDINCVTKNSKSLEVANITNKPVRSSPEGSNCDLESKNDTAVHNVGEVDDEISIPFEPSAASNTCSDNTQQIFNGSTNTNNSTKGKTDFVFNTKSIHQYATNQTMSSKNTSGNTTTDMDKLLADLKATDQILSPQNKPIYVLGLSSEHNRSIIHSKVPVAQPKSPVSRRRTNVGASSIRKDAPDIGIFSNTCEENVDREYASKVLTEDFDREIDATVTSLERVAKANELWFGKVRSRQSRIKSYDDHKTFRVRSRSADSRVNDDNVEEKYNRSCDFQSSQNKTNKTTSSGFESNTGRQNTAREYSGGTNEISREISQLPIANSKCKYSVQTKSINESDNVIAENSRTSERPNRDRRIIISNSVHTREVKRDIKDKRRRNRTISGDVSSILHAARSPSIDNSKSYSSELSKPIDAEHSSKFGSLNRSQRKPSGASEILKTSRSRTASDLLYDLQK